jgi:hypothetical protein
VAGEDVIRHLVALGLWAVCVGCAHGPATSLDDRTAALLVAIRYTMLNLADTRVRAEDERTWKVVPFCIDVDEQPAPTNVLEVLRSEGFEAHGEWRYCANPDPERLGRAVHVDDLQILGETATARVGVSWGEGGTLKMRRVQGAWKVTGMSRRWISRRPEAFQEWLEKV